MVSFVCIIVKNVWLPTVFTPRSTCCCPGSLPAGQGRQREGRRLRHVPQGQGQLPLCREQLPRLVLRWVGAAWLLNTKSPACVALCVWICLSGVCSHVGLRVWRLRFWHLNYLTLIVSHLMNGSCPDSDIESRRYQKKQSPWKQAWKNLNKFQVMLRKKWIFSSFLVRPLSYEYVTSLCWASLKNICNINHGHGKIVFIYSELS